MAARSFFGQIFAKSPISPIQNHMKIACSAAALLPDYFDAVFKLDWELAKSRGAEIQRLEEKADVIKREIRAGLSRSLFMPVSRVDLLELLKSQDKIPNRAKDIVGLSMGREMEFPAELGPLMREFVQTSVRTAEMAMHALDELDQLFESGFGDVVINLIADMITKLNTIEHEADLLQRDVQNKLYALEKNINPVDVMFFYRIIEWIGDIADNAQSVGNRMLNLIAK